MRAERPISEKTPISRPSKSQPSKALTLHRAEFWNQCLRQPGDAQRGRALLAPRARCSCTSGYGPERHRTSPSAFPAGCMRLPPRPVGCCSATSRSTSRSASPPPAPTRTRRTDARAGAAARPGAQEPHEQAVLDLADGTLLERAQPAREQRLERGAVGRGQQGDEPRLGCFRRQLRPSR